MSQPLLIDVITIFPRMLDGFCAESMMKRAARQGAVRFRTTDPRDFTSDVHRSVDDRPYGGGPGMVMKPEPLCAAVEAAGSEGARVVLPTPQGIPFTQRIAQELSHERHLVFLCGHYEGVDERVRQTVVTDEFSIGDYVLTNGTLAATVMIDAVVRLLPGVLGGAGATEEESFSDGLLEYPQYTRPVEFRGMRVPDILLSGNHGEIARWRAEQALTRTEQRRPDMFRRHLESKQEEGM